MKAKKIAALFAAVVMSMSVAGCSVSETSSETSDSAGGSENISSADTAVSDVTSAPVAESEAETQHKPEKLEPTLPSEYPERAFSRIISDAATNYYNGYADYTIICADEYCYEGTIQYLTNEDYLSMIQDNVRRSNNAYGEKVEIPSTAYFGIIPETPELDIFVVVGDQPYKDPATMDHRLFVDEETVYDSYISAIVENYRNGIYRTTITCDEDCYYELGWGITEKTREEIIGDIRKLCPEAPDTYYYGTPSATAEWDIYFVLGNAEYEDSYNLEDRYFTDPEEAYDILLSTALDLYGKGIVQEVTILTSEECGDVVSKTLSDMRLSDFDEIVKQYGYPSLKSCGSGGNVMGFDGCMLRLGVLQEQEPAYTEPEIPEPDDNGEWLDAEVAYINIVQRAANHYDEGIYITSIYASKSCIDDLMTMCNSKSFVADMMEYNSNIKITGSGFGRDDDRGIFYILVHPAA